MSAVDKQRLYDAYQRQEDYVELAKQLGINCSIAWAMIKRADENDGQITHPRGVRHACIKGVLGQKLKSFCISSETLNKPIQRSG